MAPKLRRDLVVSRQETAEGSRFVVKDPATGRYFRFGEAEYFIARQLDGATEFPAIAKLVASELGAETPPETLEGFVADLRSRGLLEEGPERPRSPVNRGLFRGNVLWLRIAAFDPDHLLGWLVGKVRFFFTPHFVLGSAVLILWALCAVFAYSGEIALDLTRLWSVQNLLLAWLILLVVTAAHEFAHGLTCKHFGGQVNEIGFLLIYFQPAFYCNISDAWLFPQRSRRLWVTFAGAYFELFLWALATLVWQVTEPDAWVNAAALIVMATSGIKTFFNLNPLIKLDGYYLLSDLLDVPNLRQRAFSYVGSGLRRLLGLPTYSDARPLPRERRIFLAYGLLAGLFSYWLLSMVLLRFGEFLTNRYQGWGFMLFATLVGATFSNPLARAFKGGPAKLLPRSRWLRLLGIAAAGVGLLYIIPVELRVSGEVTILPSRNIDVRAEVEGFIETIQVEQGSQVATRDAIARISDRELRVRLQMVEAEIEEHAAHLRLLVAGPRDEEIEIARICSDKAEGRLRYAKADLERFHELANGAVVSRAELEQAQERVVLLAQERDEARGRHELLCRGSRPEEIAAIEQEIARSEAERRRLEDQLARTLVLAPHPGVVTTPKPWQKVGQYVKPGDLVVEIHSLDRVTAEIGVSERDIGEVQVGQSGSMRLRAYPKLTFEGVVTAIAPVAFRGEGLAGRVVTVQIEIPNDSALLRSEMTGVARIHCGKRRALDVLTRRFRRFLRVEFWSWW